MVAGYLESITSGDEFIRVAESVAAIKPVVILKGGTTSAGPRLPRRIRGLGRGGHRLRSGVQAGGHRRADTFEALFDFATAFAMQPLPKGNRVAIITNAGGPGTMAADAVEQAACGWPR